MLVNEEFKNFNLAENFQKRIKCAARLLDILALFEVRVVNLTTKPNIANKKFFTFIIWQLVTAKICFKSSYFWFLWQAKDQNIQLKTNYGC